ncbi:PREDICTED: GDP-fucose protein O-fucosyltransferase 2, partial [Ceratosolen solmsi marchali]|uniref:GDP-fucose protein O-fucosyltransferase 2 n=1 Tax=Ceratosolen solmsi marchali TaxID=326594 RepID=A0AAJ6YS78_9HYME
IIKSIANDILYCQKEKINEKCTSRQSYLSNKRYFLYDVNPPEGFNLRRDVYIRVATFLKQLIKDDKIFQWNVVLPPWGNLYHWQSVDLGSQQQIPWQTFFDMESLKKYLPVIELFEFIKEIPSENEETIIDVLYFLKNDEEMFRIGNFEDKNIFSDCLNTTIPYKKNSYKQYTGSFWGYTNVTAREVKCITFHGTTINLKKNLQPLLYRSIMFDHMEIPLHYNYGSVDYWNARRSMRYNTELHQISNDFRLKYLNSNDMDDRTIKLKDWRLDKKKRNAIGGPYLSIHLRRQDFLIGHAASSPTIEYAAFQIKAFLKLLDLKIVYIATDTNNQEYIDLKEKLKDYSVFRYIPTQFVKNKFKDGGIAIIDQIICSHARYFVGTHESTFSFRIQEDREILGFPTNTTFNVLCGNEIKCSIGNKWEIIWG